MYSLFWGCSTVPKTILYLYSIKYRKYCFWFNAFLPSVSLLLFVYMHLIYSKLLIHSCQTHTSHLSIPSFSPLTTSSIYPPTHPSSSLPLFLFSSACVLLYPALPPCCSLPPSCQPPWQVIQILWALRPPLPKWWMLAWWELSQVLLALFSFNCLSAHSHWYYYYANSRSTDFIHNGLLTEWNTSSNFIIALPVVTPVAHPVPLCTYWLVGSQFFFSF